MNGTYHIVGGHTLRGSVRPIPNKNSLQATLPLAILAHGGILYRDLPRTSDVECLLEIYRAWGATVEVRGGSDVFIDAAAVTGYRVDRDFGRKLRGAIMFVGPLLARFGAAEVPLPGGCELGERSVSVHVNAFKRLGVSVEERDGYVCFKAPRMPVGGFLWMLEASVTGCENIAMYAAGKGTDLHIVGSSCEPHVCDLLRLMVQMGAKIDGIGTNQVVIGAGSPLGSAEFVASPDHVDIAGYYVAAAVTGGTLRIEGANIPWIMDGINDWFRRFGVAIEARGDDVVVSVPDRLTIDPHDFPMAGKDLPKLAVRPWPGFPVDILPVMLTLASKAEGSILLQNWMYESGFDFVRELNYLGAEVFMADPQKVIVMAPVVKFKGGEVSSPGVIQATKAIFLAALADKVETVIHGTDILRRRYPAIIETYRSLGAEIEELSRGNGAHYVGSPLAAVDSN